MAEHDQRTILTLWGDFQVVKYCIDELLESKSMNVQKISEDTISLLDKFASGAYEWLTCWGLIVEMNTIPISSQTP